MIINKKYLDYFEDGINDFIKRKENRKLDNTSLLGCLEWIRQERVILKDETQNEKTNKF